MHSSISVLLSCLYLVSTQKTFPSRFPRCYRDDPRLNECLLVATRQMKPHLQKGIPELNIPSISPFYVPQIQLQQNTNAISYQETLTEVLLTGLDSYNFKTFNFDVKKMFFTGFVEMGVLNIRGNYSIKGKLLTVPIEGKGSFNTTILSSNATVEQQAKLVTRKGIRYLESEKIVMKINIGDVQSDFNGLFDDNEVLAKAARNVLDENLREVVEEIKPAVEEVCVRIMEDIVFKNIAKVPYDDLFPLHK